MTADRDRLDEIRGLYALFSDEQLQALRTAFVLDLDAAGLHGDEACEGFCTLRLAVIAEVFALRDAARRQGAQDIWRQT